MRVVAYAVLVAVLALAIPLRLEASVVTDLPVGPALTAPASRVGPLADPAESGAQRAHEDGRLASGTLGLGASTPSMAAAGIDPRRRLLSPHDVDARRFQRRLLRPARARGDTDLAD